MKNRIFVQDLWWVSTGDLSNRTQGPSQTSASQVQIRAVHHLIGESPDLHITIFVPPLNIFNICILNSLKNHQSVSLFIYLPYKVFDKCIYSRASIVETININVEWAIIRKKLHWMDIRSILNWHSKKISLCTADQYITKKLQGWEL